MTTFDASEESARELDRADPLGEFRELFEIPTRDGTGLVYFCGNSLGLMPRAARKAVVREMEAWGALAVDGHFKADHPWYSYHAELRESGARLVGAQPHEVVFMNGLTVNLHLMFATFFRPAGPRRKILVEPGSFPSDSYAVKSQLRFHGLDPDTDLIRVPRREESAPVTDEDVLAAIDMYGAEVALVFLGGVNYFTGKLFDIEAIAARAHEHGCKVGFDLAHSAGNVPHELHDWGVDFAAWCTYKYLNAGPGAVAGCFVHEKHCRNPDLPQLAGWWGNDPETRFQMNTVRDFTPVPSADRWQLSNPPVLAMAPVRESLEIFDRAGMDRLRQKSVALTRYLEQTVEAYSGGEVEIITPSQPSERGCQLSLRVAHSPQQFFDKLHSEGVIADFREPDVVRIAPTPLYNTFHEVWRFGRVLRRHLGEGDG